MNNVNSNSSNDNYTNKISICANIASRTDRPARGAGQGEKTLVPRDRLNGYLAQRCLVLFLQAVWGNDVFELRSSYRLASLEDWVPIELGTR